MKVSIGAYQDLVWPGIEWCNSEWLLAYICRAHYAADLLHGIEIRAQSTMHCEDLLINDCCNGQAVETIGEGLPQLDVVSPFAFVVKPIDSVDGGALVVSAQNEEVLRIFDLVC